MTRLERKQKAGSFRLRCLVIGMIAVGLGSSVYLLVRILRILAHRADDSIPICTTVFGIDCDETLLDPHSWYVGLPLAAWGVTYFAPLAALVILVWALGEEFRQIANLVALIVNIAGVGISLTLLFILASGKAPFCPLCVVVHSINLLLLPLLWWQSGWKPGDLPKLLRDLVTGEPSRGQNFACNVVGILNVGLLAIVVYQWVRIEIEQHAAAGRQVNPRQVIANFDAVPSQQVPIGSEDPRPGPIDAPAQLVVFSDFRCRGCQVLAGQLAHLALDYPEQLVVVHKHFPLGTACNPAITNDKHPTACQAARAAEAAHRQGRFWEFHDAMFDPKWDTIDESTLLDVAQEVGLNLSQFRHDLREPESTSKIRTDCELGKRLGIRSTPAVFINGRLVKHPSRSVLDVLIHHELVDRAEVKEGVRPE